MRIRNCLLAFGLMAPLALTGCNTTAQNRTPATGGKPLPFVAPQVLPERLEPTRIFSDAYGPVNDSGYAIPAVPIERVNQKYHRQIIDYASSERPGTIIVNTRERFLYYILPGGRAVRYGIGVGKDGFAWSGTAYVAWKQEWPRWHPPKEMTERQPKLARYADGGMGPGLSNPLGARALYLFDEQGKDTLFRLHGTPEWNSIGTAASSGCIRMINQDVIDLYSRVRPGRSAKVIVIQ